MKSNSENKFKMKWWGWGAENIRFNVQDRPGIKQYVHDKLQVDLSIKPIEWDINKISIPAASLPDDIIESLKSILGQDGLSIDRNDRIIHAYGKSYKDLLRIRSLKIEKAPDVVLYPSQEEQIVNLIKFCKTRKIALVPFGGGSSVVSGLEPEKGGMSYLASLDMSRFKQILSIDQESMTATIQAGKFGPELEDELNAKGFTLGHFPQSFEFSTLGGWIAARSSGQNSILYGGIERLVISLRIITPAGIIETLASPPHACGPDIREMLLGSEGIFGVITSATVKICPLPEAKDYFMLLFKTFGEAARAGRMIAQRGLKAGVVPAMLRISDEDETAASLAMSGGHSVGFRAGLKSFFYKVFKLYLRISGFKLDGPLSAVFIGLEGNFDTVEAMKTAILSFLSDDRETKTSFDFFNLGSSPGKKWLKDRFFLPYLRDDLMDNKVFIETLETVTTWSNLFKLYNDIRKAISAVCEKDKLPVVVYTHISHLYPEGASLYFTIMARQRETAPLQQWVDIKTAANKAIADNHAAISHHHGVGMDHKSHLHWNGVERALVKGLKNSLDPEGLFNPGKLL